ncbi:MAG TPA: nickel ABC transporter permease [Thermomicrobiales bacterium]|jgi:ABC-type dipeptide/oligopeptide/nickel transport system permease component|nr:nickel ABC transporter permease [Thermomicrobiales bacterium]
MTGYVLRRLGYSVFVLWGALTIVFIAVRVLPGDPAQLMLGATATEEDVAALQSRLGLDQSLIAQYGTFLTDVVRLDFGDSLRVNRSAAGEVAARIGQTALLAAVALVMALAISFPLGILAALQPRSIVDRLVSVVSLVGQSVPSFWLGIVFILVFARELRWLPSAGSDSISHLVLPALTLALPLVGVMTRLVRSGLVDVLVEDYIRTARAKGLAPERVLRGHAMRNMLIPVITMIGLQAGNLLGGAVIVETVFAWPGIGRLLVEAIDNRDYPVIQAVILLITATFVLINLLVDLSYGLLDPRIRLG